MPDNKREEARLKEIAFQDWKGLSPKANTRTLWQHRQEKAFGAGYDAGKRAGAASIDRVQVVRIALQNFFEELNWVNGYIGQGDLSDAIDAYLEAMEKGK